ncbi:DUF6176 family protein [Methanomassiliicoccus luminyensis]|nr:DUF6176 family protein [Methanomassiliicoccus luminyensis]
MYKAGIIRGMEDVANEWLSFLRDNGEAGMETLKNEKVYLESYFQAKEGDSTYVYMLIVAKDVEAANNIAGESKNDIDLKYFEYMGRCIDPSSVTVLDCSFYMENLSGLHD